MLLIPITTDNIPQESHSSLVDVVRVVDGDTLQVNIEGELVTVRLIGVDTPEIVDPRRPVQCFGQEASNKAKELLENSKIKLEPDETQGDTDRYQRLLRYVFLEDGTHFNKLMIEQGFAHEYTYNVPYRHRDEFVEAENYAKTNKLGLWADNVCN